MADVQIFVVRLKISLSNVFVKSDWKYIYIKPKPMYDCTHFMSALRKTHMVYPYVLV